MREWLNDPSEIQGQREAETDQLGDACERERQVARSCLRPESRYYDGKHAQARWYQRDADPPDPCEPRVMPEHDAGSDRDDERMLADRRQDLLHRLQHRLRLYGKNQHVGEHVLCAFEQTDRVLVGKSLGRIGRERIDQHEVRRRQPAGYPASRQRQPHLPRPDQDDGADVGKTHASPTVSKSTPSSASARFP